MFDKLFTPITIKDMTLRNRIIMPAMGTRFTENRFVNEKHIAYHVARARGGSALNIVEVSSVHALSAPKMFLSIAEDKYIPKLKELTDAIHAEGGKAGIQLWQGGLAVGMDQTAMILLSSDTELTPGFTVPGISKEMIAEVVDCYGKAAARAVAAGFDCIEFHCAHNYLPHSFLSDGLNHRTDEYGGSLENRARFPLACIRAIRAAMPEGMPLFMRIDAQDDGFGEAGLTVEDTITFCNWAKDAGVDVLDVSRGNIVTAASKYEVPPLDLPRGFNVDNAARIRKGTGMLTIGVGRINDPQQAEDILEADKVDMVVMGRAQLADPDFCNKCKEGRVEDIDRCVGCNQGCLDGFADLNMPHITCLRNPAIGRETECAAAMQPTRSPKTILIAGGGIAGLEAARTLKLKGHNPILCEATDALGGQFVLAGKAPRKEEMEVAIQSMAAQVQRMGVEVRLNTPVTLELIEELKPAAVFNCIGATPLIPKIPGAEGAHVANSHDVLAGKVKPTGKVVIIGGGMVGMEVAELLAEQGCTVTDLEMMKEFCADLGSARKICVTESIYAHGITPVTEVKVTEIREGAVLGEKDGKTVEYPCDWAVLAIGSRKRDGAALEETCRKLGIGYLALGDAAGARRAMNATREAYDAALRVDDAVFMQDIIAGPKTVFVTGATGTMGQETVKQLLARSPRFKVRVLARPSDKNRALLKKMAHPMLEVVWGDMADLDCVKRCVAGADYVLHIGAMVSPAADKYPEKTLYTNIGSTLAIIKAIQEQPNADDIHLVYVGTVAETGDRQYPVQMGRCGDPINPSIHDYYAISKVFSEFAVFESGLKHWVSIRQTGQYPTNEGAGEEPIIFHQPPNNVLEWSTSIESGICMANICENWVPESFWRKAYNLSSGKGWRFTCWEFTNLMMEGMGMTFADTQDPRRMAKYNFHGHYFSDADALNDILHFRCIDPKTYQQGIVDSMKAMMQNPMIAAMIPGAEAMKAQNVQIGHKRMGYDWMMENNETDWINAFFGSKEEAEAIPSLEEGYKLFHPSEEEQKLDHGYDESKDFEALDLEDMKKAAAFRGGEVVSDKLESVYKPLVWKCAFGHTFKATPNTVLRGGHWCPECQRSEWHYAEIARKNPFYAQVWKPIHGDKHDYHIPMAYSAFDITKKLKEELNIED